MEVAPLEEAQGNDVLFPVWMWDEYSDVSQVVSVEKLETCIHYRSAYACIDARGNWYDIKWVPVQKNEENFTSGSRSMLAGWLQKVKDLARGEATYSAQFLRGPNTRYSRDDLIGSHHPLTVIAEPRTAADLSRRMDRAYATHSIYISETIELDFGVHGELSGYRIERPLSSLARGEFPGIGPEFDRKTVALADRFDVDGALDLNEVGFSEDLNLGIVHHDSAHNVVWAGVMAGAGIEVSDNLVLFFDEFFQIVGAVVKQA